MQGSILQERTNFDAFTGTAHGLLPGQPSAALLAALSAAGAGGEQSADGYTDLPAQPHSP